MVEYRYYTEKKLKGINFYIFPSILLDGKDYNQLTNDSIIVYAVLLRRMQLSISKSKKSKNWTDEDGNVFMYFTLKELADSARVSLSTVRRSIAQLIDSELLIKRRQGAGKPDRLYLLQPDTTGKNSGVSPQPCECSEKTLGMFTQNTPECSQRTPKEKEKVNNNLINPPFIPPWETEDEVRARIDYQSFKSGDDIGIVDKIIDVLLDVQRHKRKTFRIGTYYRDTQEVQKLFARVDRNAAAHVIQAINEAEKVDNFHAYVISVLYNYLSSPAASQKPKKGKNLFTDCQQRDGTQFNDALRELGLS